MPELRRLDLADVRNLCAESYGNGVKYFRGGAVRNTWRTPSALHAAVSGSASEPYEASAGPRDDGSYWARCTCPAARRQSICKHAAALLVAWAERPDAFVQRPEPETKPNGAPKVESEAKRVRTPKVDRRDLIAEGLDKAESLLVDLCSQGLLSVTREQVETIGALAQVIEAHKLRRLARQVAEIQRAALLATPRREEVSAAPPVDAARGDGDRFDERTWARLLSDTWFVLSATRKALAKGGDADQAELEELVGKTWLEKDLRRVSDLRLLELAYQAAVLPSGFRVETSYLLDLGDGTLYTEKQITPLRLKDTPWKRSYSAPLRVAAAGVYPGFPPLRVKLVEAEDEPEAEDAWDRAIALAETSATALRQRLIQATANLTAPQEAYSLFRPDSVLADGESIYLVDAEQKAIPISGERRAVLYGLRGALARGPLGAVFCRVRFAERALEADPLGVVLRRGGPAERLVRLVA